MINIWADLSEIKREFPIETTVVINESVEDSYWGEEVGGKLAKVVGYEITQSMLLLITETGKEILVYPDQVTIYF